MLMEVEAMRRARSITGGRWWLAIWCGGLGVVCAPGEYKILRNRQRALHEASGRGMHQHLPVPVVGIRRRL